MGITKSGHFKRKLTGGRRKQSKKKRAYEKARPASSTKLGGRKVRLVRVRGGGHKFRALRLNHGNFAWRSEQCTRKSRLFDVVYNAANNEYVRTKTLTKNAIVLIDATPFKTWYKNYYNVDLVKGASTDLQFDKSVSNEQKEEIKKRREKRQLPKNIEEQFAGGRLYACLASKPGQVGRADGYILESDELEFYLKKMSAKKKSYV